METIKNIEIEDIEELFDSEIFERGEEYFEEGLVKEVELIDEKTLSGSVIGNDKYRVTISVDSDGDIICDCSCPCDFNCKHAAALLLKWIKEKNNYLTKNNSKKNYPSNSGKEENLQDILSRKTNEELINLIIEFIKREPQLKSLIIIRKNEIFSKVKRLFSNFWEWNEIQTLFSELNLILDGLERNKSLWSREIINEMEKTSLVLIGGQDNVHDNGELGDFLNSWFELYGEIFASLNPSKDEKKKFILKIKKLFDKDEYGFEGDIERALFGMCKSKDDIKLIKENCNIEKEYSEEKDLDRFYLELYEKIGADKEYIAFAKEKGFSIEYVDKLISLGGLKEALEECNKQKEYSVEIEERKIKILNQIGKKSEAKTVLFELAKSTCSLDYILKLKKESSSEEWEKYKNEIIEKAKKTRRNQIVSKIYYHEGDYLKAYEYSKTLTNSEYLELLSKKLIIGYPNYASLILGKLVFQWISSGSGYPYKKAGKLLKEIKKIDNSGSIYVRIKKEVIAKHKKKYSLMNIIEKI
ncbi:MAG: SWIM zinc finger family protein [Nanoarchaeota archaeon]